MNAVADTSALRHIIVVGGSLADWAAMSAEQWAHRLDELGKVADHVGASWLTLRPYSGSPGVQFGPERVVEIGHCRVCADPQADGQARVAEAAAALDAAGEEITEDALAGKLNAPALADPDLVVVLGPPHHLPPSLVWELAYSELVFIDVPWADLAAGHLDRAIDSYSQRHRRFGGVDD
ncbi:MAG: undecaprenyl diphosphate synthase family protein [Ilumatobacteraceae bacterium]